MDNSTKFIFLTDTHLKSRSPVYRKDNFENAILEKLSEISNIAKNDSSIKFIIHGGDFFDIPRVSPELVSNVSKIIMDSGIKWYIVPGNHDIYRIDNISNTMLGLLKSVNIVDTLTRTCSLKYESNNKLLANIVGHEYCRESKDNYRMILDKDAKFNILVCHSMLLNHNSIIPHTKINEINPNSDLLLTGHYHKGFDPIIKDKTIIINPGATARLSTSKDDIREPQYVIVDLSYNQIQYKLYTYSSAKKHKDVIDINTKEKNTLYQKELTHLKQLLAKTTTTKKDYKAILSDLCTKNKKQNLEENILNFISDIESNVDVKTEENIEKFNESKDNVFIIKIEAKNFQSHRDLNINLSKGINILKGESDSGKTAILRMIHWVHHNEPTGNAIISSWAKKTTVKITYSNGYTIEKSRTRTSSPKIIITDENGKQFITKNKGLTQSELYNITQSPLININDTFKLSLNYSDQLEAGIFIMNSPSERAAALDYLTNTHILYTAIRELNKNNRNLNSDLKATEKILNDYENKAAKYYDLDSEKKILNTIETDIEIYQDLKNKTEQMQQLCNKYKENNNLIQNISIDLSKIKIPDTIDIQKLDNLYNKIQQLNNLNQQYNIDINNISILNNKISNLPDYNYLENIIKDLNNLLNNISKLEIIFNNYNYEKCSLSNINNLLSVSPNYNKLNNDLIQLEELYSNTRQKQHQLDLYRINKNTIYEIYEKIKSNEELSKKLNNKIMKFNGMICPTCNNVIKDLGVD